MKKNNEPVIVEQKFSATIDTVWKSITEIDRMRQWYFENIPLFEPEVGFETQFNVESGGRNFLHMWKVTEVVPMEKIAYDWRYGGYAGDSFVVFELFKQDDFIKLRLTHNVRESFPDDVPKFSRESCIGGLGILYQEKTEEIY
jgi:uncharacterized protein YndB with AHSA1/START domain